MTHSDGTLGTHHVDPSVDSPLLRTTDGSLLRAGATARVEVRVFASDRFAPPLPDPPPDPGPPPIACGTGGGVAVIDDHDDLVFEVAP